MQSARKTRGRYALRWVLGVGLVFVVVVGMGLQLARVRAEEQWEIAVTGCNNDWSRFP